MNILRRLSEEASAALGALFASWRRLPRPACSPPTGAEAWTGWQDEGLDADFRRLIDSGNDRLAAEPTAKEKN
jgi:hypothetical protein